MSPVVAAVLLLGVTITLALVVAPVVFGTISDFGNETPDAEFAFLYQEGENLTVNAAEDDFGTSVSAGDGTLMIQLETGESLDPANIEVRSSVSGGNLLNDTDDVVFAPGERLRSGDSLTIAAQRGETVEIIWTANDGEESAVLGEFTIDVPDALDPPGIPEPDYHCGDDYVENQTPGDVTIDGVIVRCDIDQYDIDDIDMVNGGGVIGNVEGKGDISLTDSGTWDGFFISGSDGDDGDVNLYNSTVNSDVQAYGDGNVDVFNDSHVDGDIRANGTVDLDGESTVGGGIEAGNYPVSNGSVTITGESTVGGPIDTPGQVSVDGGSEVDGSITSGTTVSLDDADVGGPIDAVGTVDVSAATIEGSIDSEEDVSLVDSVVRGEVSVGDDLNCVNSTIDGQSCDEYKSPIYQVTIDDTNSPVEEGSSLAVKTTINNTGFEGTQNISLEINGTAVDTQQISTEGTIENNFTWDTNSGDAGDYVATVVSEDDSDSEGVTIISSGAPFLEVSIDSYDDQVFEGEKLNVTATVTNSGNQPDTQTISLYDFDGNGVDAQTVSVNDGESEQVTLTWQTVVGDAGQGNITVASEDDAVSRPAEVKAMTYDIVSVALFSGGGNRIDVDVTVDTDDSDAEMLIESLNGAGVVLDSKTVAAQSGVYSVKKANQADAVRVTLFDGAGVPRDSVTKDWNG